MRPPLSVSVLIFVMLFTTEIWGLSQNEVGILVFSFSGGDLGKNVGNVLSLKIWRTTQRPPRIYRGEQVTEATVSWPDNIRPPTSFDAAEAEARSQNYEICVWGSIVPFGNGVVAQPMLSLWTDEEFIKNSITCTVSVRSENSKLDLSVSIPRLRYVLPPIKFEEKVLDLYSDPSSIALYKGKGQGPPAGQLGPAIGKVGDNYRRLRDEGDFSLVQPLDEDGNKKGQPGWIFLPELSEDVGVVNFVGGLIRLVRQDYSGAIRLLIKVSKSDVNGLIKVDSLLLHALATAKLGGNFAPIVDAALKLNPYLQTTVKFKIFSLISQIKAESGSARRDDITALERQISQNSYLFSPDDSWLESARKILSALKM